MLGKQWVSAVIDRVKLPCEDKREWWDMFLIRSEFSINKSNRLSQRAAYSSDYFPAKEIP
jgi:hypothetical protein